MRRITTILTLILAFDAVAAAQDKSEQAFYKAFYLENALRDLAGAEKAYGQAAEVAIDAKDEKIAVRALVHRGHCLRALGKEADAKAEYQRALALDPDNAEIKAALKDAPGTQDELRRKIASLINKLGGAERKEAEKDLRLVGALAVPQLEDALRSREVGIVAGAARVLARNGGARGAEAIARAIRDPRVVFQAQVAQSIYILRMTREKLIVADAGVRHQDVEVRALIVQGIRATPGWCTAPALKGPYLDVVAEAAKSTDSKVLDLLLRRWDHRDQQTWHALLPTILRELQTDDVVRRRRAMSVISANSSEFIANLPRELRDACARAAAEFLGSKDKQVGNSALTWLKHIPGAWKPEVFKAVLGHVRQALSEPLLDVNWSQSDPRLRVLDIMRGDNAAPIPIQIDLLASLGRPSTRIGPSLRHGVWGSVHWSLTQVDSSSGARRDLLDQGLRTIQTPLWRRHWLQSAVLEKVQHLPTYLAEAEHADIAVRMAAYSGILLTKSWPEDAKVPSKVGSDLKSDHPKLPHYAWEIARLTRAPSLADGARRFIERLEPKNRSVALELLLDMDGAAAIPDAVTWLKKQTTGSNYGLFLRLLRIKGAAVVDDLVDIAVATGPRRVLHAFRGDVSLPTETMVAFLRKLPESAYDSSALWKAAGVLPAKELTPLIMRALEQPRDGEIKASAATIAGVKHLGLAWPRLLDLMEHEHASVRKAAKAALDEIRWFQEVKGSLEAFGVSGRTDALKQALSLAEAEDPVQRRGAAFALSALRDQSAIPALLKLLVDPDQGVREAASEALRSLSAPRAKK